MISVSMVVRSWFGEAAVVPGPAFDATRLEAVRGESGEFRLLDTNEVSHHNNKPGQPPVFTTLVRCGRDVSSAALVQPPGEF
jgi:hypothetical protein